VPATKTTTLTFRLEPSFKETLRIAAARDHRSTANMVAVMIRVHCTRVGIPIQDKQLPPAPAADKPKSRK
jgi:predicted DNA-binding ribbon-helix-helix protein